MHEGGTLREIADRAGVDGGDGAGKLDAMGDVTERFAQRQVGKQARREDRREAAPFDLAGNFERGLPSTGYGHQTDGGKRVAQFVSPINDKGSKPDWLQVTRSSFCSERIVLGCGVSGKLVFQLV